MIKKITIERFKNIKLLDLELETVNVLVGSNNAGKSSVLQAIQFCVSIAQTSKIEPNAWWRQKEDFLPTSLTPEQLMYSPTKDVYSLAYGGRLTENEDKSIKVSFLDSDNRTSSVMVRKGRNKNISISIKNQDLGQELQNIEKPFSIYAPGLAGIPAYEEYRSLGIVNRATARGDANNYFRNILLHLRQLELKWEKFLIDFNDIFPDGGFKSEVQRTKI